jgi:hypothetical protein
MPCKEETKKKREGEERKKERRKERTVRDRKNLRLSECFCS